MRSERHCGNIHSCGIITLTRRVWALWVDFYKARRAPRKAPRKSHQRFSPTLRPQAAKKKTDLTTNQQSQSSEFSRCIIFFFFFFLVTPFCSGRGRREKKQQLKNHKTSSERFPPNEIMKNDLCVISEQIPPPRTSVSANRCSWRFFHGSFFSTSSSLEAGASSPLCTTFCNVLLRTGSSTTCTTGKEGRKKKEKEREIQMLMTCGSNLTEGRNCMNF